MIPQTTGKDRIFFFVQLQQPAVTTGMVGSREQASCNKTKMGLSKGLLEIQVRLGGRQIRQQREWIIAIDAVQRWHSFQSPIYLSIYLSAECVCAFRGKAKRVTGSERACETVDEAFPSTLSKSKE